VVSWVEIAWRMAVSFLHFSSELSDEKAILTSNVSGVYAAWQGDSTVNIFARKTRSEAASFSCVIFGACHSS
jgi:hypothetical protein